MCESKTECARVAEPGDCSPEQVRKCHGEEGHPCADEGQCLGAPEPAACTEEQKAKCHGVETKPTG